MAKPEPFSYQPVDDADFEIYRKALLPLPTPIEQTLLWGAFNDSLPGRRFLGSFCYKDNDDKFIALASATLYEERGRTWIWIKHGPLFAHVPNTETIGRMCEVLKAQFADTGATFIRLSLPTSPNEQALMPFEHTMYDQTVIVPLDQTEEAILAGMSKSGRRSLRNAQKQSIVVNEVAEKRTKVFEEHCYPILKETAKRDGFGIHPINLYISMLEALGDHARLYTASIDDNVEAWAITTEYNGQSMYYYGGSSALARTTDAAYKLHWEIMMAMKARGNTTYDLMGIAGKHYLGLQNVTQFKIKFSKNIVSVPITYDLPLKPFMYRLLALAVKLKRSIKR